MIDKVKIRAGEGYIEGDLIVDGVIYNPSGEPLSSPFAPGEGTSSSVLKGGDNIARGNFSSVEGFHTITNNTAEHAEGQYNVSIPEVSQHTVGIGDSSERKNAHLITIDGKHYIPGVGGYVGTESTVAALVGKDLATAINDKDFYVLTGTGVVIPTEFFKAKNAGKLLYIKTTFSSGDEYDILLPFKYNYDSTGDTYYVFAGVVEQKTIYIDVRYYYDEERGGNRLFIPSNASVIYLADTASVTAKYTKPASGIPASDLASAVQNTLVFEKGSGTNSVQQKGTRSSASGNNSHAVSRGHAKGEYSHAEGYKTTAFGINSHSEGRSTDEVDDETLAKTDEGIIEDWNTSKFALAKGDNSHVEGYNALAIGAQSHAEGSATLSSGENSHAEGWNTKSIGPNAHSEGRDNTSSGNAAHTEGRNNIASAENAHAEGYSNTVSGTNSHVENRGNTASGTNSHAEGQGTTASGNWSHSEGYGSNAGGAKSHVEGNYTQTTNEGEHAEGKFNVSISGSSIHSVGIGTSNSAKKNAHLITLDGKHYIPGIGDYVGNETSLTGRQDLATVLAMTALTEADYNEIFA